jgi:oligopeptide transport system substrate-binding protein
VAQKLHDEYGFSYNYVGVLKGGWNAWKEAGYPTATGPASGAPDPPTVPQILRYGVATAPDNLDPQFMRSINEISLGQLIFEGLLELNAAQEPVPGAAAAMEVSADGLKYTLALRDDLTYSDGTPLTARHFEYAWRRALDPREGFHPYGSVAYDIVGAEELANADPQDHAQVTELLNNLGVKALDDTTIEFTLKNRAAYFPYILTLWIGWPSRQDLVEQGGATWYSDKNGAYYIGNGPYVIKSYDPPREVQLVANPYYRKGKPKVEQIAVTFLPNGAAALQAYQKGDVDVLRLTDENYQAAQADPALKDQLIEIPGSCTTYLHFNTTQPPFDEVKVRQAVAQALDRADFARTLERGLALPALSLIPPGRPGAAPDLQLWAFDPAQARRTLSEAGFPDGQDLPPITLTYTSGEKERMEWVQRQLRTNLGIRVQLNLVDQDRYSKLFQDAATIPSIYFDGWCEDYPDPQNWLSFLFRSDSTVRQSVWESEEFDQLTRQADAEEDPSKRQPLYRQAHELLAREAPLVFLVWGQNAVLIQPYVRNMRESVSPRDLDGPPGFFNIINIEIAPH